MEGQTDMNKLTIIFKHELVKKNIRWLPQSYNTPYPMNNEYNIE